MKTAITSHVEETTIVIDTAHDDNGQGLRSARRVLLIDGLVHVTLHAGVIPTAKNHGNQYSVTCSPSLAAFVAWRWVTLAKGTTQSQVDAPDAALVADLAAWGNRTAH
ncbi:hypothetical protein [Azotobacter chroococcum]|uniref:hypothetical protein n=1 Tax=Azotobacter chroococcum TaxID=353 RepID=UPI0010AEE204|nr:hypothetical protein [Azotobacter chroococcum]TKD39920.1 hypothetical protein FCG41_11850 [Azotobacter chroococcum]